MSETPRGNADEVGSNLNRVNQLGAATEHLFSRLYKGLTRRSRQSSQQRRRQELQQKIDSARLISEKNQQLKESLQKREIEIERLNGILAAITEGIIMQDEQGEVVFINNAARDLLGSQKNFWESDLGMLFERYRHTERLQDEITPLGEPTSIQVNNRVLGAQLAAVANSKGERLGTMIVLRDVTRDALSERLKDQFVTAISHELKTPMTVIKGMSEVLMSSPEDRPMNRRLLETLSRNVDILDRMVVELLDVSEMGAGSFDIRQNRLKLEPILWSVINGVRPDVKQNELDVTVMARNVQSLFVNGDDQRLRWALGHILQNSIRYTEPGGNIVVTAGIDADNPDQIIIDIIDNGVGISDKDLPHIFERFYRGDPRSASSGKLIDPRGLGQGLFVARTVAEAHGGYLTVNSQTGHGSIFSMVLPAANSN
jgi:signal transduction histidine kinase